MIVEDIDVFSRYRYCPHCGQGQEVPKGIVGIDFLQCPRCGFAAFSVVFGFKPPVDEMGKKAAKKDD